MQAVGAAAIDAASLFGVLAAPPTLNAHTRYTAVMSAGRAFSNTTAWYSAIDA